MLSTYSKLTQNNEHILKVALSNFKNIAIEKLKQDLAVNMHFEWYNHEYQRQ